MKDSAPSPRRLQYLRDYRRRKRSIRLWQVCLLAGLFVLWELTTRLGLSDGFLTSSPSRMAGTLQSLWHSGDLWRHIGTSCLETVVGFTAGTLLGTAIAVAMWWWEKLARVLDPYLVVLNALPKTALPATSTSHPAAFTSGAVFASMPPSHSSAQERPRSVIQARIVSIFGSISAMNFCPPKPGSTVITSTMSSVSSHGSTASAAVAGLSATAAIFPAALISAMAAVIFSGVSASACTVTRSAPASQKRLA